MSHTLDLQPSTGLEEVPSRRLVPALLIALAIHAVLLALPISLRPAADAARAPLRLSLIRTPAAPEKPQPAEKRIATRPAPEPEAPRPEQPPGPRRQQAPAPDRASAAQPPSEKPGTTSPGHQPARIPAPQDGAKSPSTVFDPRLAERLSRERNKVRKFQTRDAEFTTANGTFIQKGDHCAEIKKLLPGDIDSTLTQPFRIKCTERRRSREDVDRLARKYGIP